MKYDTVEIRPSRIEDKWYAVFTQSDIERVAGKGSLHAGMGFYHYPRKIGDEKAFETLKQSMIDVQKKEIELLNKSINELKKLRFEK